MTKAEVMEKLLEGYQAFHKENQGYKDVKEMAEYMQEKGLNGFPYKYTYKDTFTSLERIAKELEGEGYLEREIVNENQTFRYRKEIENEPKSANRELRIMEIAALNALRRLFNKHRTPLERNFSNEKWNRLSFFVTLIKKIQEIRKKLD